MSNTNIKLVWLVSGNTFSLDEQGNLVTKGHSGKWIANEVNEMLYSKVEIRIIPIKGILSYLQLWSLDMSTAVLRIQGVEFYFSLFTYLLFGRRASKVEFDLQGFPDDIASKYFEGSWLSFNALINNPVLVSMDLLKWFKYYIRGRISRYLLGENVYFRGRTNYDKSKVRHQNGYVKKEREVRSISKTNDVSFTEFVILIPQVHYPTKGFHLIIHDLINCSENRPLRVYLGGSKPQGYYGKYVDMLVASGKGKITIDYVLDTEFTYDDILYCCDVLLLPSIVENSSNSIKEAMHLDKICIVQNSGGNAEMIKDYPRGYLYCYKVKGEFNKLLMEIYDKTY